MIGLSLFSSFSNCFETKTLEIDDMDVIVQIDENEAIIGSGVYLKSAVDTDLDFQFTIPETLSFQGKTLPITTLGDHAFYKTNLNKLLIPKTLKTLKSSALELCYKLNEIEVDPENEFFASENGFLTSKDKTILYRFTVDPEADQGMIPSTITSFSDACFSATPIKSFQYLPKYKEFGEALFSGCKKLKKVTFGKSKITKISHRMFFNCPKLTEIELPKTINYIGDKAFKNTPLSRIPYSDKFIYLGSGAFQNTQIRVADLFDDNITVLSPYLFAGCKFLEKINLPDVLDVINETTFKDCTSLMTVIYRGAKQFTQKEIFTSTYPKIYVYTMRYPWYQFCDIDVFPYDPHKHPNLRKAQIGIRGMRI